MIGRLVMPRCDARSRPVPRARLELLNERASDHSLRFWLDRYHSLAARRGHWSWARGNEADR